MSTGLTENFLDALSTVDRYVTLEALAVVGTGLLTAKVTYSYYKCREQTEERDFFDKHRYIMWLPLIPSYIFAIGTGLHLAMSHHKISAMLLGRATRLAGFCTVACGVGWVAQVAINLYQSV